jgi:hypothetical protein
MINNVKIKSNDLDDKQRRYAGNYENEYILELSYEYENQIHEVEMRYKISEKNWYLFSFKNTVLTYPPYVAEFKAHEIPKDRGESIVINLLKTKEVKEFLKKFRVEKMMIDNVVFD